MTAKILRLAKLQRKLDRMPKIAKKRIRDAMAKGADEIVALAKKFAAVSSDGSWGRAPGALRDSIGWVWGDAAPKGSFVIATLKGAGLGQDLRITIYAGGPEAFYARWVEFGTIKMRAQPYFFTSYRALKKRTKNRIGRSINKAGKEVARGG